MNYFMFFALLYAASRLDTLKKYAEDARGIQSRRETNGVWAFTSPHIKYFEKQTNAPLVSEMLPHCPNLCPSNDALGDKDMDIVLVLKIRVYEEDKARLGAHELIQWIQYHRIAGVNRFIVCDSYQLARPWESVLPHLFPLVESGVIEYYDAAFQAPPFVKDVLQSQMYCYNKVIPSSGATWVSTIDVDEYVVGGSGDNGPGFLRRTLIGLHKERPNVGAVMLENFIMHGYPENYELLINRLSLRTKRPANALTKYFVRLDRLKRLDMHTPSVTGEMITDSRILRMHHFWGSRVQGWTVTDLPDHLRAETEPHYETSTIASLMMDCSQRCSIAQFHWLRKQSPFWVPIE